MLNEPLDGTVYVEIYAKNVHTRDPLRLALKGHQSKEIKVFQAVEAPGAECFCAERGLQQTPRILLVQ